MVFPWYQAASQKSYPFYFNILVNQFEEKPNFYVIISKYSLYWPFILLKLIPGDCSHFLWTRTEINVDNDPNIENDQVKNLESEKI